MDQAELSVSIVIPTLNPGRTFGTVLHRIMGQGVQPLEILVVDGGSGDGTRHITEQFPLARFIEASSAPGPRAWNQSCAEASGQLIAFLAQDAVPADGDWLLHLTEPFSSPSVAASFGAQQADVLQNPLHAFRLARRFPAEGDSRRARFGDPVRYESLAFSIEHAALRRSVWRNIRFNEHLPLGADREWVRQVLLASYTVAYLPSARVDRSSHPSLRQALHAAVLTGWTDAYLDSEAGSLLEDPEDFVRRAAWHLVRLWRWDQLPYLAILDAAQRYGYRIGKRLHRLAPVVRNRVAPEVAGQDARAPFNRERAA